ncbi:sulfatase-like hydrolase/transferase [Kriegella sp. EG-1]|nr:sulfatase-like hydrolase/transferase [Flavobacteriaceae bacterium EG-1]
MKCAFLFVLSGIFLLACKVEQKENKAKKEKVQSKQPNIVFYLADDQDIYDYGCYGNEKVYTPAVDRLAKEGMLFENAFTGQAICAPSRAQLFTGKYPLKNGCFANHTKTKPDIKSATSHMQKLGYEVVLAGKSHVKPASVYDWNREWEPVPKAGVPREYIPLDSIAHYFKHAKKPFCMFITSKYPHGKYFDVPDAKAENIKFYPFNARKKSDASFVKMKAGYYISIEEDNRQLELVLDLVGKHLDRNTLFIYSADHGVSGKFTVKDVGLKVPFVARWPDVIKAGTISNQLIHYTDVLPTFIEMAGGTPASDMDGKSFLSLLKGQDAEIHKYVYGVRTNQNILNAEVFPSRMVRDKRYKYIRNFNSIEVLDENLGDKTNVNIFIRRGAEKFKDEPFEELYDTQNDPFEQKNLIEDSELQEIKNRLRKEMFRWMEEQGDFLNDELGNMPILTANGFKMDQNNNVRTIPDSLLNTLKEEDYFLIEHW